MRVHLEASEDAANALGAAVTDRSDQNVDAAVHSEESQCGRYESDDLNDVECSIRAADPCE